MMEITKANLQFKDQLEPLKRSNIKSIILHHLAYFFAEPETIHQWHLDNGWSGAGYNFYVRKSGEVIELRGFHKGAHTKGYNSQSLGIAFEGDFDKEFMQEKQLQAGIKLIKMIREILGGEIPVKGHKDYNNTLCPGKYFSMDEINKRLVQDSVEDKHWANESYHFLNSQGIKIHEKRFDDKITRGEVFAIIKQIIERMNKNE